MIQLTKKICLIGDFAVGKTSLVRRFVDSRFDERYLSTIGVRVSRKVIPIEHAPPTNLTLMVWDTAGGEPFSTVIQSYYRGASGALLVCDLTRSETLVSLLRYAQEFCGVNPSASLVLIGNKVDLTSQRMISDEQLATIAESYGAPWFMSSAKTGIHVDQAFQTLGTSICRVRSAP
ncbi:MAG: GTP-binding protein [Oscillochloris sp.]|nr:GTP-binding protein [Oscillochloris sp.]